jgi:hypothetical protein
VPAHFESIGHPIPLSTNPAEYLLDLVNADFEGANGAAEIQEAWASGHNISPLREPTQSNEVALQKAKEASILDEFMVLIPLLKRSIIKSYRDVLAYGVRYAMYVGLAIMMGTVWLQLETHQDYIQSFINAIVSNVL